MMIWRKNLKFVQVLINQNKPIELRVLRTIMKISQLTALLESCSAALEFLRCALTAIYRLLHREALRISGATLSSSRLIEDKWRIVSVLRPGGSLAARRS